ncbi:MAG: DNA methyltransferase [Pseudomonadales bacterium]
MDKRQLNPVHQWADFYAAFSDRFADETLSALDSDRTSLVVDPFAGSGTTLVSALLRGSPAIGIDLDPFACLLSRAKLAISSDRSKVKKLLGASGRKSVSRFFHPEAQDRFDADCLAFASTVFTRVLNSTKCTRENVLATLLEDVSGQYDSEVVAITALCLAASKSSKLIIGSNPTWHRRAMQGELIGLAGLHSSSTEISNTMLSDLQHLSTRVSNRKVIILNGDTSTIANLPRQRRATHVLTSPPYLTRLDYIVKHLPNLLILSGLTEIDLNGLRKSMMGTTLMVDKSPPEDWGSQCLETLEQIRNHQSYASERYYYWTYTQYFKSLHHSLTNIANWMDAESVGVLVVQDGYYKDVHVKLGSIVAEMLGRIGFSAQIVKQTKLRPSLSAVNPTRWPRRLPTVATEDVVLFEPISS